MTPHIAKGRVVTSVVYLICFISFFNLGGVRAQAFMGTIAQGVGGAGRSAADSGEIVLLNPASLVHTPKYTFNTYYSAGSLSQGYDESLWGLLVSDNHPGVAFPGAITYIQSQKKFDAFPTVEEKMIQISLGSFLYSSLAVGASIYRLEQTETGVGGGESYRQWNGTLGLHWNPFSHLGLGLVYHNFRAVRPEVPSYLRPAKALGLGATFVTSKLFNLKFDITSPMYLNPNNRFTYHGGLESTFSRYMTFRIGGEINEVSFQNSYAMGLTFDLVRWILDYSVKISSDSQDTVHSVDLRISI